MSPQSKVKDLKLFEAVTKSKENENRLTILETQYQNFTCKIDDIKKEFSAKLDSISTQLTSLCNPMDGLFSKIVIQLKENTDKIESNKLDADLKVKQAEEKSDLKIKSTNKVLGWVWGILGLAATAGVTALVEVLTKQYH